MARAMRGSVLLLAAATVIGLSACGSSKGSGSSTAPTTTQSSQQSSASTPAPSGSGAASGTPADAATTAAIKEAYSKFFSSDTPEGESLGYLQDGQAFKAAVEAQAGSDMAKKASAEVSKVTMISANSAEVTFSILLAGNPMLPNYKGYAVREGGKWKVAGKTFCELMTLQGQAAPACNTPEGTSLPD
jgi:hypothetical protein